MTDILLNGKKVREIDFQMDRKPPRIEITSDSYLHTEIPLNQIFLNDKPAIVRYITDPRVLRKDSGAKPHIEISEIGDNSWETTKIPLDYESCDKMASFDEDHNYYKRICKLVRGHIGDCDWSTRIEVKKES